MGKIRMLSESLIGKIAAGEVVERPVAAIKELIENSLDAGASAVTTEIREGGLSYIRVTDNGCGIDQSDLKLAFERHATSKISKEPDLFSIQTLGFRGEALASIAAVSHTVLTTRVADKETGLKVTNEGGRILKIEEAACTVGTSITVTDLFFNTPVRKGFMKKASVEASAINELLEQFVLSRPDVSFRFINDGKTMIHSPGDGQMASAMMTVFGSKSMKSMREVNGHINGIILRGYVGIGENARGNRSQEYFFINNRMMHSGILSSALEMACRERIMIGKFPVCALHLTIAYDAVDVNVHPNKLEVRFRDESAVSDAVISIVHEALKERDAFEKPVQMELSEKKESSAILPTKEEIRKGLLKPDAVVSNASVTVTDRIPAVSFESNRSMNTSSPLLKENSLPLKPFVRPVAKAENNVTSDTPILPADKSHDVTKFQIISEQTDTILPEIPKTMKVFGALFNTFILVEYDDQLLFVDQHAVHERLLFDRLMAEQSAQNIGQDLLVPLVISVSSAELAMIEENQSLLQSAGLVMERFGEHEAAVRTIPVLLGETAAISFVREILEEIGATHSLTFEKKRAMILQSACKHAVKGGETLTEDQLRSLLREMIDKQVTPTCPHGRPLVVSISHRDLDKKFKRIQG